ncbi:MAG TPA: type II toxin-antitoxin system HipA family toxin [Stenotrophomonas sp.]|jgi:serine/threonine-protein kinase HipA
MAELQVWMNGEPVATWREDSQGARLTYADTWTNSPQSRPISLSLPLLPDAQSHRGAVVTNYFDNLLPDNDNIRRRMRDRFSTASTQTFALLNAVGRDCVGAIQLLPPGRFPEGLQAIAGHALDEGGVAALLRGVTAPPVPGHRELDDEFRLSLAGAQEKTALLWHQGQWFVPEGTTPSTHIFKLPLGLVGNMRADMSASVENEWLCMQLLAAFGLPVATTELGYFEDQRCLIVERFDRRLSSDGRWWIRLPQEDMCQVFGMPSGKKYEADGGPGVVMIMDLLRQSTSPSDREVFFQSQLLFWLLAATDGHAKNFSLFIEPGGRFRMTPLYDVLSVYPILGRKPGQLEPRDAKLAMAIAGKNRHRRLVDIRRRHWNETARACGLRNGAEPFIDTLLARMEPAILQVQNKLPAGFPTHVSSSIFDGLRKAGAKLSAMAPDA